MRRTPKGKFAKGNPGGPGRPPRQYETDYLRALTEVCTLDDWQAIVRRAVEDAKAGDAKARQWLASYVVGEPTSAAIPLSRIETEDVERAEREILDRMRLDMVQR